MGLFLYVCLLSLDYAIVISDDDEESYDNDDNNMQQIQYLLCMITESQFKIYNLLQNM